MPSRFATSPKPQEHGYVDIGLIKHDSRVNSLDGITDMSEVRPLPLGAWGLSADKAFRQTEWTEWQDSLIFACNSPGYFLSAEVADPSSWTPKGRIRQESLRPSIPEAGTVEALAQSFLDKEDEDWTFIDPDDVKRLARAVLSRGE